MKEGCYFICNITSLEHMFLLLRCINIPPPNLGKNVSRPLSGMHELHIVINVTCFMSKYFISLIVATGSLFQKALLH